MATKKTARKKATAAAAGEARGAPPTTSHAVTEWPRIEVLTKTESTRARKAVESLYGKTLASKASDRLCQALSVVQQYALESTGPRPRATILEFTRPETGEEEVWKRAAMLAGSKGKTPPALLRLARRELVRDQFARQVADIRAQLEKKTRPMFPAGLEALASPTTPSSVVQICWLNGTIQSYVDPRILSDVAGDKSLQSLDLPRPLLAEIDQTGSRVGAVKFRKNAGVDGSHVTIAVIDTEVDINHPAVKGRVIQKVNYTKERWGSPAPHGTAVAGIIASIDGKYTGMAPGVTITNYKILCTDENLNANDFEGALAIQQALEDGAQIANCSWGAGPAGDGTGREAVACNTAWDLGLMIVKSAGNNGPNPSTLTTPADADGVIVVGATDRMGTTVQDYSSRGPAGTKQRPHLIAPGGSQFEAMHSAVVLGGFGDVGAGTSYAAPHVSGLAALLLAQNPGLEPDQLRDKLIKSCKLLAAGDTNTQGNGFVSL